MSLLYATTLIFNLKRYIRYIKTYQKKEQSELALKAVQALQEKYREALLAPYRTTPFLYKKHNEIMPKELNRFATIALTLKEQFKLYSQDKYKDYNMCKQLYDFRDKGALAQQLQDIQRQRQPKLALLAINILSIPAMSNELERVFSSARRTISQDKGQIILETIK